MKRIQLLQQVKIDGVEHEPGFHSVEDGYAESLCNAGWARLAPGKAKAEVEESASVDDDKPASTVPSDDDKPVEVPVPAAAPKRSRKR